MRLFWGIAVVVCASVAAPWPAMAAPAGTGGDPWTICKSAIAAAERAGKVPRHLLLSIALVESGRLNEGRGGYDPWPWTINAAGDGQFFDTKAAAVAAVLELKAKGHRNIDVGCMQVNQHYHPDAFADLDAAFDPATNAAFAARFLRSLFQDTGSWMHAVARYHSSIYRNNRQYMIRVMKTWRRLGGGSSRTRR